MMSFFFIVALLYPVIPLSLQPHGQNPLNERYVVSSDDLGEVSDRVTDTIDTTINHQGKASGLEGNVHGNGKEIAETSVLVANILSNQKEFVENAHTLDPNSLGDVIEKINSMLEQSREEEKNLTDTLTDKLAAFNEGSSNLLAAQEALQKATAHLATTEALHVVQTTEKNDAQDNYDNQFQQKKQEQQVLTDVLNLLNGLPEANDCSSATGCKLSAGECWCFKPSRQTGSAVCGYDEGYVGPYFSIAGAGKARAIQIIEDVGQTPSNQHCRGTSNCDADCGNNRCDSSGCWGTSRTCHGDAERWATSLSGIVRCVGYE